MSYLVCAGGMRLQFDTDCPVGGLARPCPQRQGTRAQADPGDCVLIDGTPVPGYIAAPAMTGPGARVSFRPLPPEDTGLIMANGEVAGPLPFSATRPYAGPSIQWVQERPAAAKTRR